MISKKKIISLEFKGYRLSRDVAGLPEKSGVYCAFRCVYQKEKHAVKLKKLIYIGQADDLRVRICQHENTKKPDWNNQRLSGETLCYAYAFLPDAIERNLSEAALIFRHKPPENIQHKHDFGYDVTTTIKLSGETEFLDSFFTVDANAKD